MVEFIQYYLGDLLIEAPIACRSRYAMYARYIGNKCDCRVFRIIYENPSLLSSTHN